jgi:uncharacterized iron-regulated protein
LSPGPGGHRARTLFTAFLLPVLILPLFGCAAFRPEHPVFRPSPGVLFSRETIHSLEALPGMFQSADYLLIGEGHTNPCDHRMQKLFLDALAGSGERFILGLEMVDLTLQDVLDRFNRGELQPDELEEALDWPRTWGHPFSLYRPIFEAAARWSIPVHALNLPSALVRTVGREGIEGLDQELLRLLPSEIIMPPLEQERNLREQYRLHRAMLGEEGDKEGLERFMLAQSLRDTIMAESAVALSHRHGEKVVIIAGGGHVAHGWGIPRRVRAFHPEASVLTIQPWRGGRRPAPGEADLFFYCPERHRSRLGFELQEGAEGLLVSSVLPGSRAEAAGIRKGDRIVRAGEVEVRTMFDLHKGGVAAGRAGEGLVLEVLRDGERIAVPIAREQ